MKVGRSGGHEPWWVVEAETTRRRFALLPAYVAERTDVRRVDHVRVP